MKATLNTIDVVVSNLDAAMAFYRRLGLDFEVDPTSPGHAGCDLPGGLHLMLDNHEMTTATRPNWTQPAGGPPVHLCFELPGPTEVDAAYAELTGAGYRGAREPWDAFWGMRYATVLDPDGNGIDLYAHQASE